MTTAPVVPVIAAQGVSKVFPLDSGLMSTISQRLGRSQPRSVRAVDDVSFEVMPGETVGIVGESGCGKSTLARILAGIAAPTEGQITFQGKPFDECLADPAKALRVQMIFQDPQSSINPRLRVGDVVGEAPVVHGIVPRSGRDAYVRDFLNRVGLDADFIDRYPHQFSGGQRQRIGIARALAVNPELLICDESVAALDVSVQAQIINLLMQIRADFGLTMLFISHDLSVIRHLCDRVIVMYLGRIVEVASARELFENPRHPYTRMLLAGMPRITTERREFLEIEGEIPSPINPPPGCHFNPRCKYRTDHCLARRPPLETTEGGGRRVACLNWREIGC